MKKADNSRPLATEVHPNPSVPELAEENVRGKKELSLKKNSLPSALFNLENLCLKKQMADVRFNYLVVGIDRICSVRN